MNRFSALFDKYFRDNIIVSRFVRVFSVDVLVRGANFLLIPVFLYIMTQEEYGLYGYLYSFAMTMTQILGFGLYVSLTKLYADTHKDSTLKGSMLFTLTSSMFFLLILSIFIILVSGIDKDFFSFLNSSQSTDINSYATYRIWVFVAIFSMVIANYLSFFLVSSEKISSLQGFNLLRFFLTNLVAIGVIYFSDGDAVFQRLAYTYLIEIILCIGFYFMIIREFRYKFSLYFLKKGLKIGLPVMVAALMYAVLSFGDKYFVFKYSGEVGMSIYYLAFLISSILLIIYQSFNFIWNPLFMKEKDLLVLRRKTNRYIIIILIGFSGLGTLICLGVYFLLWLGVFPENYSDILPILPLLLVSQILSSLNLLMMNFMTYFEKTYIQVFVGAILSIIGYFLFDYMGMIMSIMGISIALIVLNLIQFAFYYFRVNYYINNRIG
ncbi:MAG: oligosaccharide flippase family protein [Bacteroidales bacterium]|jgi:O-antigen/teichoic acid export membrane protein|nr:oligosaccharide flippase family protein [Bacteroidales bacterium]